MRREEGAGLQWDKPSLTLRAAFLLRLASEGRKQESTRSQQAHKGYDAQENVHGGQLGLQHLARDNEGEKLQDSHRSWVTRVRISSTPMTSKRTRYISS